MKRVILVAKIVLSAGIALGLNWWFVKGICSMPKYAWAETDMMGMRGLLEMKSLNARISNLVDPELEKSLARYIDPWGHPYRYTEVPNAASSTPDFRIYSMGRDGQSASGGNDPDDINSWDDHHVAYYNHVPLWRYGALFAFIQLVFGVPVFLVIHGGHLAVRGIVRLARAPGVS